MPSIASAYSEAGALQAADDDAEWSHTASRIAKAYAEASFGADEGLDLRRAEKFRAELFGNSSLVLGTWRAKALREPGGSQRFSLGMAQTAKTRLEASVRGDCASWQFATGWAAPYVGSRLPCPPHCENHFISAVAEPG